MSQTRSQPTGLSDHRIHPQKLGSLLLPPRELSFVHTVSVDHGSSRSDGYLWLLVLEALHQKQKPSKVPAAGV